MDEKTTCATRKTIYELKPVVQGKTMKIKKLPSDVCPYIVQDPKTKRKWVQVMKRPEPRQVCTPKRELTPDWTTTVTSWKPKTEWIPKREYDYSTTEGFLEALMDLVAFLDVEKRAEKQGVNDWLPPKHEEIQDLLSHKHEETQGSTNNSLPHTPEVINLVDDDEDENLF